MSKKLKIFYFLNLLFAWALLTGTIADSLNLGDLLISDSQNLKYSDTDLNSGGKSSNRKPEILKYSYHSIHASIPYFDEDSPSEEPEIQRSSISSSLAAEEIFFSHSREEISEELFIINRSILI